MDNTELKDLPPQDIEAEKMVLGACLLEPKTTIGKLRVRPEDFYVSRHACIMAALMNMHARGDDIDIITASSELRKLEHRAALGNAAESIASYLTQLWTEAPTTSLLAAHEELVIDAALRRRIIRICKEAEQQARDLEQPETIITAAVSSLNEARGRAGAQIVPYRTIILDGFGAIEKNFEHRGRLRGFPTGFPGIDRLTNGLQRGWYYILAGRTGRGKTALSMQIARAAAKAGNRVGVISLEMDAEQLGLRDLASEADVPLGRILSGHVNDDDWERLAPAAERLSKLPCWGVFSAFTAADVERAMGQLVQVHGCELIVVDYLQLMTIQGHDGTREQEVSKISRMHKRKAKELGVAMLVLAQLNRAVETRQDKRPTLADLRESGSLEQDADVVAFVHHDECKCPASVDCHCGNRYKAYYLQRKGRMNGTGDVELHWDGRTTTFRGVEE